MMAQMRTGLRAYALDGHTPAGVVERLNRLLLTLGQRQMTTVAYAVLDLEREQATLVSAGHLPPLLRAPGGETVVVGIDGSPPLGVSPASTYVETRIDFPAGSTLLLATDGAVEVRGEGVEVGLERLRALLEGAGDLSVLCQDVAEGIVRGAPADDDVAVLGARLDLLPDELRTTWPASPETLPAMRPLLRRWLSRWGAAEDEIYDIIVAVQEASANAVEHAYAPGTATYDVSADCVDGVISFVISDRGSWREPRGTHRGRGISMMRALMETVEVTQDEEGTRVELRRTLGRQAA
jgi:anti-sigma regulatory factor (Ser/Thr protein kinase)